MLFLCNIQVYFSFAYDYYRIKNGLYYILCKNVLLE